MTEHEIDDDQAGGEPTGKAAANAVAESRDVSSTVQASALAYFMGEVPPPAKGDRFPLEVDFGTRKAPNFQTCTFRTLVAEEFDKTAELGTRKNAQGVAIGDHPFVRWSYNFAYACLEPDLGGALGARRQKLQQELESLERGGDRWKEVDAELKRLTDTAALVREVFRWQPGVLQRVSAAIEGHSRMTDPNDESVREVEAGKTSS